MPCPRNHIDCPCTKDCPCHGKCCECVAHHKEHGKKLPACLMGIEWEGRVAARPSGRAFISSVTE